MTNGSIDIENTQGDVSGVIKDSIGSIAAKAFNNYGTLVINNATKEDLATLTRIRNIPAGSDAIEKGIVTKEEFNALRVGVNRILSLLETNQAQTIKAGNMVISRSGLSSSELNIKANEYFRKGEFYIALDYYDQALRIDTNGAYLWYNKGLALRKLGKYNEVIQCYDRALQIDPNYALAWYNKGLALNNFSENLAEVKSTCPENLAERKSATPENLAE